MGETKEFRGGEAEFHEPSRPWTVIERGRGRDRRPGPPGASPGKEARHDAHLSPHQADLPVRPENPPGLDRRAEGTSASAPSSVPVLPPQGHDEAQGDRPKERRSANAGSAPRKRGRGRLPKKWVVRVRAIDPEKYAQFMRYPRHPCAGMKPEDRLEDISTFCARLWARTCQDTARRRPVLKEVDRETRRKAA